jgi:hypothetical protein
LNPAADPNISCKVVVITTQVEEDHDHYEAMQVRDQAR